ncbi:MAG: anti-sigma factor antagonist [Pseudonocardiales bacterium]|nr:anti-sigma factor antagonist [Pseudonocardiales bacterium]
MTSADTITDVTEEAEGSPSPEDLLTVHTRTVGAAVVIAAVGEIDMMTAPLLERAIAAESPQRDIVLDLTAVSFIGSTGLGLLLEANRRCHESNRALPLVVGSQRAVIRTITASGLAPVLSMRKSVSDALAQDFGQRHAETRPA